MKVTPKPEEIRVDPTSHMLNRSDVRSEINPPDMNALEFALAIKDRWGAQVDILSMGPVFVDQILRVGLAMGADHIYLLSDKEFAGADTLATTYTLAKGIEKIGPVDLIICGEESSDGATGQVPAGVAEWMEISQLTQIDQLEIRPESRVARGRRPIQGGFQIWEVPLPAVASIKVASNEPRFIDYRIKEEAYSPGRLTIWTRHDLPVDERKIGLTGSPTRVSGLAEAPTRDRKREQISGTTEEIAQKLAGIITNTI
jgi:electron transfer flavoprotein beta subunit